MKLLSLVIITGVAALPQAGRPAFDVELLSAGATPHSSNGRYSFIVATGRQIIHTSCQASRATYDTLVSVPKTDCEDSAYSWSWTVNDDGSAELDLWYKKSDGKKLSGKHQIPKDQITWTNAQSPTGKVQVYSGPVNVTVAAETV